MMEISKNTLKRGIESDIVFKNIYLLFNNFKNHLSFSVTIIFLKLPFKFES